MAQAIDDSTLRKQYRQQSHLEWLILCSLRTQTIYKSLLFLNMLSWTAGLTSSLALSFCSFSMVSMYFRVRPSTTAWCWAASISRMASRLLSSASTCLCCSSASKNWKEKIIFSSHNIFIYPNEEKNSSSFNYPYGSICSLSKPPPHTRSHCILTVCQGSAIVILLLPDGETEVMYQKGLHNLPNVSKLKYSKMRFEHRRSTPKPTYHTSQSHEFLFKWFPAHTEFNGPRYSFPTRLTSTILIIKIQVDIIPKTGKALFLSENLIWIKNYEYFTWNALRSEVHFFWFSKTEN